MNVKLTELDSPVGRILIAESDEGVCALEFDAHRGRLTNTLRKRFGAVDMVRQDKPSDAAARIGRYLEGRLDALDSIRVDSGGTPFQRKVWAALRAIPVGETRSYAEVAKAIGRPSAVRAVARANATNPVSIVVPCHRVVRSDGGIGGYGGGVSRKRWLLAHEGCVLV
jgi:methylated-DNA-[protein]-cysteine S-methyltransferase